MCHDRTARLRAAGWFSLNVPAGLTIYWLTNNILTTAQQVYLKKTTKVDLSAIQGSSSSSPGLVIDMAPSAQGSTMEVAGEARRSRKGETFRARQSASETTTAVAKNARGKRKGSKFAERKLAEESAKRGAVPLAVDATMQRVQKGVQEEKGVPVPATAVEVVKEEVKEK
jgi:hypothetical protein